MPQIIVRADRRNDQEAGAVTLLERVNPSDFESDHFATQLVERLGWAVSDATEVEDKQSVAADAAEPEPSFVADAEPELYAARAF